MGTILKDPAEYDAIRGYLGVDAVTLTNATINQVTFLPVAEAMITKTIAAQASASSGLVPTVKQILAGDNPAVETDLIFLKAAVAAYCAYLFTPGATNAVNVSVTVGEITQDLGGIGDQWIEEGVYALAQCGYYLSLITGWVETVPTNLVLSGPSSSGVDADTISGFWALGSTSTN